jgi:GxxExxY protein
MVEAGGQETMKSLQTMNLPFDDALTSRIIGLGIEVHRELGPGFLESIYEEAMAIAMTDDNLPFRRQFVIHIQFRSRTVGEHRVDFLVADGVVVELKAIKAFEDIHFAVMRSYLRASGCKRGLLLNFAATTLQVKRIGAVFRKP